MAVASILGKSGLRLFYIIQLLTFRTEKMKTTKKIPMYMGTCKCCDFKVSILDDPERRPSYVRKKLLEHIEQTGHEVRLQTASIIDISNEVVSHQNI